MKKLLSAVIGLSTFALAFASPAQLPFSFPTANHALYEPGGDDRFIAGTPGKNWVSGSFGCVRTDGWQIHEGLDIRSVQRDRHDEPTDPVLASDDGTVVYINDRPGLSNYGRYVVLRHLVEGIEVYSLYAHLSAVRDGIRSGLGVQRGQQIAVMGRTSNTRERITKDRAHCHFELNLFYNDHFSTWFQRRNPNEHDDHGIWNGENLVGFDPRQILLAERDLGPRFSLLTFLQLRIELCRIQIRKADFPWVHRYPMLVKPPDAPGPIVGYIAVFDFNGLPFQLLPRTAAQMKGAGRYELLSVNEAEETKNPARRLVKRRGSSWEIAPNGMSLLDLLTD